MTSEFGLGVVGRERDEQVQLIDYKINEEQIRKRRIYLLKKYSFVNVFGCCIYQVFKYLVRLIERFS